MPVTSDIVDDWEETLDVFLDRPLRLAVEQRYWHPIAETATLERLVRDPAFAEEPGRHLGLFADHSAVHARDIAVRLVTLLDSHNGLLFEHRPPDRLRFMQAYGVLLALMHDVGMVNDTPAGRKLHAQFAAQALYRSDFGDFADELASSGIVAERLTAVSSASGFSVSQPLVLRELLAMAVCHSKSTVPIALMSDNDALRRAMWVAVAADLDAQLHARQLGDWTSADLSKPSGNHHHYDAAADSGAVDGVADTAFTWLTSAAPSHQLLVADVLDTVRMLRAADALRQRGADLRTSAGFEVFVDDTGYAVFALSSLESDLAFHIRVDSPLSVGEANLAAATIGPNGDLRVAFNRDDFSAAASARVAEACAEVLVDIAADVLDAFPLQRPPELQVECRGEFRDFTDRVCAAIVESAPELDGRVTVVASLGPATAEERQRYLLARPIDAVSPQADELLAELRMRGVPTDRLDPEVCFAGVHLAQVDTGDVLMRLGDSASFVYIPTAPGLELESGAGFDGVALRPWSQVGATGVLRRGERNSTVVATAPLSVIMIPGSVFARYWYHPYETHELGALAANLAPDRMQSDWIQTS